MGVGKKKKRRIACGLSIFLLCQIVCGYEASTSKADDIEDYSNLISVVSSEGIVVTNAAVVASPEAIDASEEKCESVAVISEKEENSKKKSSVVVKKKKIVIGKGEKVELPITVKKGVSVKYESENSKIASVKANGSVSAKRCGRTYIFIKEKNNSKKLQVVVKKKPTSLVLKKPKINLIEVGTKIKLKAEFGKGEACYYMDWVSSNKKVAVVKNNGTVIVKGRGFVIITATTFNGVKANIKLRFQ